VTTTTNRTSRSRTRLSRRRFLQLAAVAGATTLTGFGGSLIWANQAVRQFENDTVIPLTPWFVNTYLVRGERFILVDTGFPSDEAVIRAGLEANGTRAEDMALIFVTHGHYDHFGSAAGLKASHNVPVSIHPTEAQRLENGVTTPVEVLTKTGHIVSAFSSDDRSPVPIIPDVLLRDHDRLSDFGVNATVMHTPGHTDGSLSLLVDGFAVIGDLLAGNLFYPNKPEYPFYIDERRDQPQIIASVQRLLDEGAHTFFPGHGLPFDRVAVQGWLETVTL